MGDYTDNDFSLSNPWDFLPNYAAQLKENNLQPKINIHIEGKLNPICQGIVIPWREILLEYKSNFQYVIDGTITGDISDVDIFYMNLAKVSTRIDFSDYYEVTQLDEKND